MAGEEKDPSIEARENGPLVVKGVDRVVGPDGRDIEARPVMALCRCGASANKPFCDGTHNSIGFTGDRATPSGRDRVIAYEGTDVTVHYNPMICSHAGECGRIAPDVFDPALKPWVQPDRGSQDEIEKVVRACPSGALRLSRGGAPEHGYPDRAQVTVERNGPYWILGIDAPVPPQGEGMDGRKYVLCRCGKSGNKPFCDGTHRDAKWRDDA